MDGGKDTTGIGKGWKVEEKEARPDGKEGRKGRMEGAERIPW